ncbi:unnamed protein product [Zymoseptoria tritici ST99CH_1E4]|uniref:Uncharacterized protein n=2 Tax=Zymoseptoria tritici TaxID=1047171 RepID=F9XDX9_ZYMTI|nr:uncharacterized protein MYCGRDRAFT_94064 [Zymoseptoria tritici IPO323]EGP86571.1 hypothetical protein MYCGRDRAFT_94064 [Zymoseptoria tritici IPO323]SMR54478.1 unnamed protein product [Zymoseptoria tritici ST99CH_1E4]
MRDEKTEVQFSLLSGEEDECLTERPHKRSLRFYLWGIVPAVIIYTLAVVAITSSAFDASCAGGPRIVPNILQDSIRYQPQTWQDHDMITHPYFGHPTADLDRRWKDLLKCELPSSAHCERARGGEGSKRGGLRFRD